MPNINPAEVQKFLSGLEYPATKEQIIDHARSLGAEEEVLDALTTMSDREYEGPAEVSKELAGTETESAVKNGTDMSDEIQPEDDKENTE